jgi:hypothetical protein
MRPYLPRLGLLLALLALLLQGGSVPHLHLAAEPGLFNHDHDLSALAAAAGALLTLSPDPTPTFITLAPSSTSVPVLASLASRRHADPRAPPSTDSSPVA